MINHCEFNERLLVISIQHQYINTFVHCLCIISLLMKFSFLSFEYEYTVGVYSFSTIIIVNVQYT